MENIKIIATIGPSSNKPEILEKLVDRNIDFLRINLSHTYEEEIEQKVKDIIGYGVPVILDTEGNQIRTSNEEEIEFHEGDELTIHKNPLKCDSNNLFFNPPEVIQHFSEGDLIALGFNSVLLRVFDKSKLESEGYIKCKTLVGGVIGGHKAVHVDSQTFELDPFSKKDLAAIEIAKKHGIKHFTLSFMESPESVKKFKEMYPESAIYSKIESKKGLENFESIAKESSGILVDRGDLSNQIPIERIPFIQKKIIKTCNELGKEVFIATDTLDDMANSLKPNRAEVNDIINTILDGVSGFALTKETAVGKYPIETVNMINTIISQVDFLDIKEKDVLTAIDNKNYLQNNEVPSLLIKPHGGSLVNRVDLHNKRNIPEKNILIDEETLMDVEQIAIGSFSPLEGFLNKEDMVSVLDNMHLANGVVWPIPIYLTIDGETKKNLKVGEDIALTYKGDNETYAILHLEEIYSLDKQKVVQQFFSTSDPSHPGVKRFLETGDYFLGGKITLIKRRNSPHKIYELTPSQTRTIFAHRGWSKVLGFHTRNVIHRSHEFIQLEGLKKSLCDGLFVHPVIGKKKLGDFEADVIVKSYESMIESFYPESRVVLCTFATFSRYGGPREAIFTALVRKNFGCSHFIVGRDHTGVGDFYKPNESHNIFEEFTKEELGIIPIKFDKVFYSSQEEKYLHEPEHEGHPEDKKMHISGTQAREMLKKGEQPPGWFMREEISKIILEKVKKGEKVFVD